MSRSPSEALPKERLCSCNGTSLDHLCRVHGNHPSNIVPEFDPGECDNTRGFSAETLAMLEDAEHEDYFGE